MTDITKDELIEALRANGAHAVEALRATPESAFDEGRYESGWNGRQILAHITAIEWTYPKLIDVARNADAPADAPDLQAGHEAFQIPLLVIAEIG